MTVELEFLGHSSFIVKSGGHAVAIDPFLTDNPAASKSADSIQCTHIALTHGHADHFGDTPSIATRTGATVYAAFEICNELTSAHGLEKVEPGNPGGKIATDFGYIAFTQAFHSSSYNGKYMGMPCGVVVNIGGKTVYHAGDTALFGDMELIGELYQPDVALLPAGDRFTMGPSQAARAAEMIGAPIAVPIHYGTWPLLTDDVSAFTPKGIQARVMKAGETLELE
jgi:L-ascorbate metabolism protein UlaG (beta-lactamase superfamily)